MKYLEAIILVLVYLAMLMAAFIVGEKMGREDEPKEFPHFGSADDIKKTSLVGKVENGLCHEGNEWGCYPLCKACANNARLRHEQKNQ